MNIVFFGTPDFVIPVLAKLHKTYNAHDRYNTLTVVTVAPKKAGRKKHLTYSEVDHWAYKRKIKIIRNLKKIPKADLGILAAYGQIIPQSVINKFTHGILNIHPSLLPKYRGPSPIQYTIKNGDKKTGVTIIKMDNKIDHGPIVSSFTESISEDDTTESLQKRLFERASDFLLDLIPNYIDGKINLEEQDHKKATFTKLLTKQDGLLNLKKISNPEKTHNHIRAMHPWPGAWTKVILSKNSEPKRLKILSSHLSPNAQCLVPSIVQLEGKNEVTFKQFKQGYPDFSFVS